MCADDKIEMKCMYDVYLNSAACKKLNELATIKCRQHANYHTYCHSLRCSIIIIVIAIIIDKY